MRTIKTLGIATAMALCLIAVVGASAASAALFKSALASTTMSGSRLGANHVLSLEGESFSCSKVSFSGLMSGVDASTITVTPELKGCTWQGIGVVWAMNGCKFKLHAGPNAVAPVVGWMDIVGCESPMSFAIPGCTVEIGNQNNIDKLPYTNTVLEKLLYVDVTANLSGLRFTRSGGGCIGKNGTFTNGTYAGVWRMKGLSAATGIQTQIEAAPSSPKYFSAEEAPVTIAGLDSATSEKMNIAGPLTCTTYTLSGTSASTHIPTLTAVPKYSGCTDSFVSAGGCKYAVGMSGQLKIEGATCASSPITISREECVATIGPQSVAKSPGFSAINVGSGKLRTVSVSGGMTGVTYTATGAGCPAQGTFNNGSISLTTKLTATNSLGQQQGLSVE